MSNENSCAAAVIKELSEFRKWILKGEGYNRDDIVDDMARALDNRIEAIKAHGLNNGVQDTAKVLI